MEKTITYIMTFIILNGLPKISITIKYNGIVIESTNNPYSLPKEVHFSLIISKYRMFNIVTVKSMYLFFNYII